MRLLGATAPAHLPSILRRRAFWPLLLFSFVCLGLLKHIWTSGAYRLSQLLPPTADVWCSPLNAADDVLVIMKTSAIELPRKLPIHFDTTLKCVPNYRIYSDMEEDFNGHHIYDALDEVSDYLKQTSDFGLYRELLQHKNQSRDIWAIEDSASIFRAARILDKYKLLPLMGKALAAKPDARWFVFVQPDTYLVWSNLLKWLVRLYWEDWLYLGNQNRDGLTMFAHVGSGICVSRSALESLVDYEASHNSKYGVLAKQEALGDVVLSKAFGDMGLSMEQSWPSIQGETPASLDYTDRHWCVPVVSWYNMDAVTIQKMWEFEQKWMKYMPPERPILHKDVFEGHIEPQLRKVKDNWDNVSIDWDGDPFMADSVEECRLACRADFNCIQWSYVPARQSCHRSVIIRYGSPKQGMKSGWILDRIKIRKTQWGNCYDPAWVTPPRMPAPQPIEYSIDPVENSVNADLDANASFAEPGSTAGAPFSVADPPTAESPSDAEFASSPEAAPAAGFEPGSATIAPPKITAMPSVVATTASETEPKIFSL